MLVCRRTDGGSIYDAAEEDAEMEKAALVARAQGVAEAEMGVATATLIKASPDQKLGIVLVCGGDINAPLHISKLRPGGLGALCGELQLGDRIVQINGCEVRQAPPTPPPLPSPPVRPLSSHPPPPLVRSRRPAPPFGDHSRAGPDDRSRRGLRRWPNPIQATLTLTLTLSRWRIPYRPRTCSARRTTRWSCVCSGRPTCQLRYRLALTARRQHPCPTPAGVAATCPSGAVQATRASCWTPCRA